MCWLTFQVIESFASLRYVDLKACITRLPENGYGANVPKWPERLQAPPDRLQSIQFDAYISRKELYTAEYKYWLDMVGGYVRALHWKKIRLRNVMDMKAGFGGYRIYLLLYKSAFHLFFIKYRIERNSSFMIYFAVYADLQQL